MGIWKTAALIQQGTFMPQYQLDKPDNLVKTSGTFKLVLISTRES
jgi:hypothetical protein